MTLLDDLPAFDRDDVRRAQHAPGLLRDFNDAAVLAAADVHVARCLGALAGVDDDAVLLGIALAVRAPRVGHVCADLNVVRSAVAVDVDLTLGLAVDVDSLPWPDVLEWLDRLSTSPLVAVGPEVPDDRPLRLVGTRLYLDRYWRQERQIIKDLRARSEMPALPVDRDLLAAGLDRLFSHDGRANRVGLNGPAGLDRLFSHDGRDGLDEPDRVDLLLGAGDPDEPDRVDLQRVVSAVAVLRPLTVMAGGPGTGKTTTVARILALLDEQAAEHGVPLRVALAAPTGKAAARLQEAVHTEAALLALSVATRTRLLGIGASTLHRLLGWRPDSHSRFRHHRDNRLPHDVVVVDEASMVSLSLMAKLIDAVRSDARLILVGDPDQLASVEAGAVLGDVVGPAAQGLRMRPTWRAELAGVTGQPLDAGEGRNVPLEPTDGGGDHRTRLAIGDGIVVLHTVHRYGGAIAALALAIQQGDPDAAIAVLRGGHDDVRWIEGELASPGSIGRLSSVRDEIVAAGRAVTEAALAGDAAGALAGLSAARILCAHRQGPYGVATWMANVERWLSAAIEGYGAAGRWYPGRPLMVTHNDYALQLYNGDTGVIIDTGGGLVTAVFERRGRLVEISPTRLASVETVHAMTVHKSQGSQFRSVAVILPEPTSPILSRELLYTAATRAQVHLTVAGPEDSIRLAVARPIARASGLREGLWGSSRP